MGQLKRFGRVLGSGLLMMAAWTVLAAPAIRQQAEIASDQGSSLVAAFEAAYTRYPSLPPGSLEALAYVASRGRAPDPTVLESDQGMPIPAGVMGLHRGQGGFADLVGEASRLTGFTRAQIENHTRANIIAAAALLDAHRNAKALREPVLENFSTAFADLSGIVVRSKSLVENYARDAYAYDVLLAADRGSDDLELRFPEHPVEFDRAFDPATLATLRAPFVRIALGDDADAVVKGLVDMSDDTSKGPGYLAKSSDYAPALWVASPNFSARSSAPTEVTIHTMQGSYAGSISWFANSASQVSAHYLLRSSDGQVTQMVRNASKAWHVGIHNNYTLGIEHEGFVDNPAWYTAAMYSASAALTKHLCATAAIDCRKAYQGASSSGVNPIAGPTVKGHQHYSSQSHTDPGIHWDWPRYYQLINGVVAGPPVVLDNFESSEGHFNTAPTYSGSTVGIATSSTAERSNLRPKNGAWSERIVLNDNTATTANWSVRFLSGSGAPSQNTQLAKAGGRIGFWAYASTGGVSVAVGVDDSDGTERSTLLALPSNAWTFVEWRLDDAAQWNAWSGGNGTITSSTTLDAIWLFRSQASTAVTVYIDDVQYRVQ